MSDDAAPRPRRSGEPRSTALVPVTAALTQEAISAPRTPLRRRGKPQPWQEQVKDYDLNGPGVAGYYLDTVALMASLCPLYVSVRTPSGDWERSDDPVLQVALDAWRGTLMSQPDLVFAAVRGREALGRVWNIKDPETGHNVVSQITSIDDQRIGWRDLYGRARISPVSAVWRSWYPDPYEPWEAVSPMRRSLPNLRRLRSNIRNQTRSYDSRMTTNGIVSFPRDPGLAASRPYEGANQIGQGSDGRVGVPQHIDDFIELSHLAHTDDEAPAAMVPFPVEGPPPVWTEIGRTLDPMALEGERIAIEGFARDVNFPQQLIAAGPGAANHWNEFLLQEMAVKMFLAPKLQPVCNDVLILHLQPMVARFREGLTEWRRSVDPRHIRVDFDLAFLLKRPSQVTELFEAYRLGIATRQQVAEELSLKGEIMAIPNGMAEYEHWEMATMGKGAPYAEVDRENNLIVPDMAAAGGMGAPGELPPGDPAAAPPPTEDAGAALGQALGGGPPANPSPVVGEPLPPVAASLALPPVRRLSAAKVRSVHAERAIAASSAVAPPDPDDPSDPSAVVETSVTAALSTTPEVDPEVLATRKLYADAAAGDVRLSAELSGLLAAIAVEVEREVAKKLIMAHPPRSEIRAKLAGLPLGQVWAQSDPLVRASFPVEEVIADTVERYEPRVQAAYEEAAQSFLAEHGGLIAAVVVLAAIPAAVRAFSSGFRLWAIDRYRPQRVTRTAASILRGDRQLPDPNGPPGRGLVTSSGDPAVPPTMIVRDSMIVAGGADRDRNDLPTRDGGGNPRPSSGGRWSGGTGFLTGHNVVEAAPRRPIRWRWRHAFIRRPKEPFKAHLLLDDTVYDHPSDVPEGFFPSDHKWCTCALLPEM